MFLSTEPSLQLPLSLALLQQFFKLAAIQRCNLRAYLLLAFPRTSYITVTLGKARRKARGGLKQDASKFKASLSNLGKHCLKIEDGGGGLVFV